MRALKRWYWNTRARWFDARLWRATRRYLKHRAEEELPTHDVPLHYGLGILVLEFPRRLTRAHADALFIHFGHWVAADDARAHEWRELRIARLCELWFSQEPWEEIIATVDRVSAK